MSLWKHPCEETYFIFVLVSTYLVNGTKWFWPGFRQMFAILSIANVIDRLLIDEYWAGHTKAWEIPGTEDMKPYINTKDNTAFETIYFWPGLEKCFAQVAKVLKPGGYFLICNESDGTDTTGLKFEKIIDGMKCHTTEEIETALKNAGFSIVRTDHHKSKPWITVVARK